MLRLAFFAVLLASIACGDDEAPNPDAAPPLDGGADAGADADIDGGLGGACRGSGECEGNLCVGPNDPYCGIGPRQECDGTCPGKFSVCHVILDSCSADGYGSACGPPCPQVACDDGFECIEDACRPIECTGAADCPASQRCAPEAIPTSPVFDITAGCVTIDCSGADDSPCPGESKCVNGYCQDGLGECQLAPP